MRVICIHNAGHKSAKGRNTGKRFAAPPNAAVEIGEEYTVINVNESSGITWYKLSEKEYRLNYRAEWFIPLSEIDETEFERDYNKELQPK